MIKKENIHTKENNQKEIERELLLNKVSLDSNKNPIYWFNEEGSIIYANQASWEMLGYDQDEFLSKKVYELFDSNVKAESWPRLWNNFKKSGITKLEQYHVKKNGVKVPVELKANYFEFEGSEYVFTYVNDISDRKAVEESIIYRREFERLLFNISARFINLSPDEVDHNIDEALKEVCSFSENDSAYIYILDDQRKTFQLAHYYITKEKKSILEDKLNFNVDTKSWHLKKLKAKEIVEVTDIHELKQEDPHRINSEKLGIESFLDIGLYYQNILIGFFGLASNKRKKEWHEDEIKLLGVIGDIFINASERKDVVRKLQHSERTYREIYNATSDAIFVHEVETGKILDVNNGMLEMFEITYEEALNSTIEDLSDFSEGDSITAETGMQKIKAAIKKPQVFEWRSKTKSGRVFWTEVSLKTAEIHGEKRVLAIVRDINDRKHTEELLKKSEEQYRMIIEGQNDLIIKLDLEGKFNFVSLSYCKMFGKTEEELLGKNIMPLVHQDDQEATRLAMENLFSPPYSCYIEQRAKTGSGWKWLAWNDTAVLDDHGKVKEIIGVGRDITYQKMVESALRESEEQFRSIVQNLSDVVFLLDEKANIKYVTPSCQEYLGHPVEDLLGYSIFDLIHEEDRWLAEENFHLHLNGNDYIVPFEVRIKHLSSTYRVFEVKSQNMLNHASVQSIIYTISDITERKLMEKQVLDAIIKTEEKERERFAKDLHDDLGPLLSSIKMYIGMLEKAKDPQKQKFINENLQEIVKEAIATTKEVSNDLNPHVLNNYGLISAIELFIEKLSTEITIDFKQNLEGARYAQAIELSLYRITKELINNTIKHAQADKIFIHYVEKDGRLSLLYEDNGIGLPEKALKASKPGGMGLSNIISRAKSLNANYNFHTNLDKGFIFELHVPIIQD